MAIREYQLLDLRLRRLLLGLGGEGDASEVTTVVTEMLWFSFSALVFNGGARSPILFQGLYVLSLEDSFSTIWFTPRTVYSENLPVVHSSIFRTRK